ncbi:MAG: hypothetical protein ABIX01_19785 [Chitinophagaceae bacterium]
MQQISNEEEEEKGLFDRVGEYVEIQLELIKCKAVDTSAGIVSSLASRLFIAVVILIFVMLLNIGLALWLGYMMGQLYFGFMALAGFYAFLALLFYLFRASWIKAPISNSIVRKFLK